MKLSDLPIEVRKMTLNPGDVVVIKTSKTFSKETASVLEAHLSNIFTNKYPVIVLEQGSDLGVLRSKDGL